MSLYESWGRPDILSQDQLSQLLMGFGDWQRAQRRQPRAAGTETGMTFGQMPYYTPPANYAPQAPYQIPWGNAGADYAQMNPFTPDYEDPQYRRDAYWKFNHPGRDEGERTSGYERGW